MVVVGCDKKKGGGEIGSKAHHVSVRISILLQYVANDSARGFDV